MPFWPSMPDVDQSKGAPRIRVVNARCKDGGTCQHCHGPRKCEQTCSHSSSDRLGASQRTGGHWLAGALRMAVNPRLGTSSTWAQETTQNPKSRRWKCFRQSNPRCMRSPRLFLLMSTHKEQVRQPLLRSTGESAPRWFAALPRRYIQDFFRSLRCQGTLRSIGRSTIMLVAMTRVTAQTSHDR